MPRWRGYAYVTGKFGRDETAVRQLMDELLALGYEATYDWTANPVAKPFRDHPQEAAAAAQAMIDAVTKARVVIVLMSPELWGGLIEVGAVILASIIVQNLGHTKRIYVVGDTEVVERSIFCFHENVRRFVTVEAALLDLTELTGP